VCSCQDERHKSNVSSTREQYGRGRLLEFYWYNRQFVDVEFVVGCRLVDVRHCRCAVDRLRRRNVRQHPGVGRAAVASKSIAGRNAAVRRVPGRRRHWSDADARLDGGLRGNKRLGVRSHPLQATVRVAMADVELLHMDAGRTHN